MEYTQEKELSLVTLFWKVLFGWRRLIVMGVVFAVVVSGLQYVRGQAAWKLQSGNSTTEVIELSQEEQIKVDDIIALRKRMDEVRNYQQNSIWMNLDAYNENILVLRYYVESDYTFNYVEENTPDYTDDVVAAYCSYATSGKIADVVAEELNLQDQTNYISELITAAGGAAEDRSQNIFEIVVAYSDEETLEQIKPVISEAVEGQSDRISSEIGSHKLKLLTENISVRVDKNLVLAQKEKNDAIYSYRTQLTALETGLSEGQIAALDRERNVESDLEDAEQTEMPKPSFSVKYAIFGLIAGVFLACMWIFLELLFATKIQETEEFSTFFGIRILGELKAQKQKKRIFHSLDSLLIKWKDRNVKQISQEQRIRIVSSNLEVACKQAGVEQIYITGSEFEKQQDKSLEQIWKGLSESGIRVCKGTNVVYDAKAIKEMAEIGNVVFVEQVGVSLYAEVEKEMKAAKDNGIQIIGSVIIS